MLAGLLHVRTSAGSKDLGRSMTNGASHLSCSKPTIKNSSRCVNRRKNESVVEHHSQDAMLNAQSKGFILEEKPHVSTVPWQRRRVPFGHSLCKTHLVDGHEIRVIIDSIFLEGSVVKNKCFFDLFVEFHGVSLAVGGLASQQICPS
jgi:hypothetical protein